MKILHWFILSRTDPVVKVESLQRKRAALRRLNIAFSYEPHHEKTCFNSCANNKGADPPAHLRSPINDFVVRCLDSIMSVLAKYKISRL